MNQPSPPRSNIILIGMPGAGKSTVGVVLAKRLGKNFIDTDLLIQARESRHLQEIIDQEGLSAFRAIEEKVMLELDVQNTVVATGGSVIYSPAGMRALERQGRLIFLKVTLAELTRRIRDMDSRGLVLDPGDTLADLYRKRLPLYRRYAELTVPVTGDVEKTAAAIAQKLQEAS